MFKGKIKVKVKGKEEVLRTAAALRFQDSARSFCLAIGFHLTLVLDSLQEVLELYTISHVQ